MTIEINSFFFLGGGQTIRDQEGNYLNTGTIENHGENTKTRKKALLPGIFVVEVAN